MDFPCRPCSPFCFGQSGYDDNDVDWKLVDCDAYKDYDYQHHYHHHHHYHLHHHCDGNKVLSLLEKCTLHPLLRSIIKLRLNFCPEKTTELVAQHEN